MELKPISSADQTGYASEIVQIEKDLNAMNTVETKARLEKLLGNALYKKSVQSIKQTTGNIYLNQDTYKKMYLLANINNLKKTLPPEPSATAGTGLRRKKRVIRGRGYTKNAHPKIKPRRHYVNDNFYVDLNKLDDNILCVKYAQNDSVLPHLKPQTITGKTKEIIDDILNNKYDDRIFKLLKSEEKRDVKKFLKCVKLNIKISDDEEKEFQRQFDIVRGEYMSGNDSPKIKATLKRYVLEALRDSKIAKADAYNLLYSLSL